MKYKTLTWSEQRDLHDEGFNEGFNVGINLLDSCIRLVGAGFSDGQIAAQLGYDVSEIQEVINKARRHFPSPPQA